MLTGEQREEAEAGSRSKYSSRRRWRKRRDMCCCRKLTTKSCFVRSTTRESAFKCSESRADVSGAESYFMKRAYAPDRAKFSRARSHLQFSQPFPAFCRQYPVHAALLATRRRPEEFTSSPALDIDAVVHRWLSRGRANVACSTAIRTKHIALITS
jgi:hypothetical protein